MKILLPFIAVLFAACTPSYETKHVLDDEATETEIKRLLPYVVKKPDDISYEERFLPRHAEYFDAVRKATEGELVYYHKTDTATLFFYAYRDLSSLYEHYRGLGGYFKEQNGTLSFLNLLYHTPRLTKSEMAQRGYELFSTMVTEGNVRAYHGNRAYVHTPNDDFYYDPVTNRWDYTPNSSWKFLEDARQKAGKSSRKD